MSSITLRSPAKLNLFLRVLNRRWDGYHNLETLFERINLWDDIELKTNKTGRIRVYCNHPHVPQGPKNLVYRVAHILKQNYKISDGIDIKITKRIPVAAGLAGGSSNAASVLLGLNKIWKLFLPLQKLVSIGQGLGSDISFFLYNCSWALGLNRGDRIKIVFLSTRLWHILIVPCVKMYSSEVFTGLNLQLTKRVDNVNILIHYLRKNCLKEAGVLLHNDLESSILRLQPQLKTLKERLQKWPVLGVCFSGSGPSLFGLTRNKQDAERIRLALSKIYKQVFVVTTL